jgi:adenylate cyclase
MERKLAAILSADVKGYSRLMGDDDEATVRALTAHRETMTSLIQQHRGRVVDSPGDNLLAAFASVVDAVRCAVEVQRELHASNTDLPDDRKMEFRIGLNVGDVIVEGERIYGDGVNIAARLEGLAEAGGICISGTVYEHVENKLALHYQDLGEQTVKNIAKPVRVYRVRAEATATASAVSREQIPTLALPDQPSIAVLPFINISGDPEQEYFSDGITEDLITDLSKLSGLFVIARNSVFLYKGKAVQPAHVSRELGVRYILEGSVRKVGVRVRITAQLVDASTGYHLWAERYDRDVQDIFAVQDEVTRQIVAALQVKLSAGEQDRLGRAPTDNLEAYDYHLRGRELHAHFTPETNTQARQMFETAIALDPRFAAAYADMGWTYFEEWALGWSTEPETLAQALTLAQRTLSLDGSLPDGHRLLGVVYLWEKRHAQAIAAAERALALAPNGAETHVTLGDILNWAGRPEESVPLIEQAMRLNPEYPTWYLWHLGHAYYLTGRYEEAIAILKRTVIRNPEFMPAHAYLSSSYVALGRAGEAEAEGDAVARLSPQLSVEGLRQRLPYKDPAVLERVLSAARKAGLS